MEAEVLFFFESLASENGKRRAAEARTQGYPRGKARVLTRRVDCILPGCLLDFVVPALRQAAAHLRADVVGRGDEAETLAAASSTAPYEILDCAGTFVDVLLSATGAEAA